MENNMKMKPKKVIEVLDKLMKPYKKEIKEHGSNLSEEDYQHSANHLTALKMAKKAVKENKDLRKRIKELEKELEMRK